MKRSIIILWIYLLTYSTVLGSIITSKEIHQTKAKTLKINRIENINGSLYTVQCTTEYNGTDVAYIYLLKNIYHGTDPADTIQIYGENGGSLLASSCSVTFADNIKDMDGETILFGLHGIDVGFSPVVGGTTEKATFPAFPSSTGVSMTAASDNENSVHLFRMIRNGVNLGDFQPDLDFIITSAYNDMAQYYVLGAAAPEEVSLCGDFGTDVKICETKNNVPTSTLRTSTLLSATLKYNTSRPGDEVIEVVLAENDLVHDVMCKNNLSWGIGPIATCTGDFTTSDTTTIRVIELEGPSDTMVSYLEHTIEDYNVVGHKVDAASMEIRWDFQEGITRYYVSHDQNDGHFQQASITCDGGGMSLPCFVIFTGLTGGEYKVTVQPIIEGPSGIEIPDETNKIESDPIIV